MKLITCYELNNNKIFILNQNLINFFYTKKKIVLCGMDGVSIQNKVLTFMILCLLREKKVMVSKHAPYMHTIVYKGVITFH